MTLQHVTPIAPQQDNHTTSLLGSAEARPDSSYNVTEDSRAPDIEPAAYSSEEEALVEERLRNLGYL